MAPRKIAVFFSGRVLGCEDCLDSLWRGFFGRRDLYDIDFYTSLDQDEPDASLHALSNRIVAEGHTALQVHFERYTEPWRQHTRYRCFEEAGPPGTAFHERIVHNTTSQIYHNAACFEMIRQHSARTGTVYDVVVKFRADIELADGAPGAVDIPEMLLQDAVYVPRGRDFHGLCDALAFGDVASMDAYCGLNDALVQHLLDGTPLNAEHLCMKHVFSRGLSVVRFPLEWSLAAHVARKGDMVALKSETSVAKHLVYYAFGGRANDPGTATFASMLELSVMSLMEACATSERPDVLIVCDAATADSPGPLDAVRSMMQRVGRELLVHTTPPNKDGVRACMRKIEVHDYPQLHLYDTIMYLDCDVLVTRDPTPLLARATTPIASCPSPLHVVPELYPSPHALPWFSMGLHTPDRIAALDAAGVPAFNCGQFVFASGSQRLRELFGIAREVVRACDEAGGSQFYEQSAVNHVFALAELAGLQATDRGALLNEHVRLFARAFEPAITLHHFCDSSIGAMVKLGNMEGVYDALQRRKNTRIVVARYEEDDGWLRQLLQRPGGEHLKATVYDKGRPGSHASGPWTSHVLSNVGREAHTYLHHIVCNYDALDELTVFTQGAFEDHHGMASLDEFESRLITEPRLHSDNVIDPATWDSAGHGALRSFRIGEYRGQYITPSRIGDGSFGDWWEAMFEQPFPEVVRCVYPGAIFAVRRDVIRSWPLAVYQRMLDSVSNAVHPVEAHFMERTWAHMFGCR